jgi:uncharacterized protein
MAHIVPLRFRWDEAKNRANRRKHGISFEEASRLFTSGVDHLEIADEFHSEREPRFIAVGPIPRGLVLVVWTELTGETIRIISARPATKREQVLYHSHMDRHR